LSTARRVDEVFVKWIRVGLTGCPSACVARRERFFHAATAARYELHRGAALRHAEYVESAGNQIGAGAPAKHRCVAQSSGSPDSIDWPISNPDALRSCLCGATPVGTLTVTFDPTKAVR
jgi:hypothetical protein